MRQKEEEGDYCHLFIYFKKGAEGHNGFVETVLYKDNNTSMKNCAIKEVSKQYFRFKTFLLSEA